MDGKIVLFQLKGFREKKISELIVEVLVFRCVVRFDDLQGKYMLLLKCFWFLVFYNFRLKFC